MSDVTKWDPVDSNNNDTPPDGFPEGMSASAVNDASRAVMGGVRRLAEDGGWFDWGHTYAYVSGTKFQAQDGDFTAVYLVGRPVYAVGSTTGTIYGVIVGVTFSTPHTEVTVSWASGQLQSEALTIYVGLDPRAVPTTWRVGDVKMQSVSDIEAGWLECNGLSVARADYPTLNAKYSALGYPYGSVDGNSFNLPNFNGRAPVNRGQGSTAEGGGLGTSYALGQQAGAETHTLTANESGLRDHQHTNDGVPTVTNFPTGPDPNPGWGGTPQNGGFVVGGGQNAIEDHNNQSPVMAIVFVIKVL